MGIVRIKYVIALFDIEYDSDLFCISKIFIVFKIMNNQYIYVCMGNSIGYQLLEKFCVNVGIQSFFTYIFFHYKQF